MFTAQEKAKFIAAFEEVMSYQESAAQEDGTKPHDNPMRYTAHTDSFNLNVLIKFGYIEKYKKDKFTFIRVTKYGLDRYSKYDEENSK